MFALHTHRTGQTIDIVVFIVENKKKATFKFYKFKRGLYLGIFLNNYVNFENIFT